MKHRTDHGMEILDRLISDGRALAAEGLQLLSEHHASLDAEYGQSGVILAALAGLLILSFVKLALDGRG